MDKNQTSRKNIFYFLSGYFIIWIVLFEFILPVNNILPKPSIVLESFGDLWTDYQLPINYFSTIGSVYLGLIVAYYLANWSYTFIFKLKFINNFFFSLNWFSEFIPGIVIGFLLVYWFPNSEIIEFIFAFFTAFTSLIIKIQNEKENIGNEFLTSSKSLGIDMNLIDRKVNWKIIQPSIIDHLLSLHFYIWSMIIAFEFIKGGLGLGSVLRSALTYKDLSALFSIFIIIGITIYIGLEVIKYLKDKFIFWRIN